ncbi:MAG: hypothetical protein JWN72_1136 [Thermoleophilia bacterium]|nr:hypothetical protein [Thermoleophilia bacterium]
MAVLVAAFLAMLPAMSTGASTSLTVTATIVSATTLTNGCTNPVGFQFGAVQPGANLTTSTAAGACRFTFGSSNDSASLRIGQRDGAAAAMGRSSTAWTGSQSASVVANDAVALSALAGWTVGPGGVMQRTLDGGSTWTTYTSAQTLTGDWLRRIAVDGGTNTTLYASGESGNVIRITNAMSPTPTFTVLTGVITGLPAGSETWGLYSPAAGILYAAVQAGSTVYVARSANGGTSFAPSFLLAGATRVISMSGASSTDIWIAGSGSSGGLFHTTTGGAAAGAWAELATPSRYWTSISMESTSNGYALGSGGEVFRWNGTTWTQVASPGALTMRDITAVPGLPLVAWTVGPNGEALRTTDGGSTWQRFASGTSGSLWAVGAFDATRAIYAGDDRWVGWTSDGATIAGSNKDATSTTFADVASSPTNGKLLVEVGGAGVIRRSTDTGGTWTVVPSGTTNSLAGVEFASSTVAWAVGDGGTVLRSVDAGLTWTSLTTGSPRRLNAVSAVDAEHAWVVGELGTVLHTTNGGASWASSNSGTFEALNDVTAWSDAVVVAAGRGSSIIRTSDSGSTWTAASSAPNGGIAIVSVEYATATTLFAATTFQDVWRSTDAGATWALVTSIGPDDITSMHVLDAQRIIVSGTYKRMSVSLDGGTTWSNRTLSLDQTLGFTVVDENTIIAVGRIGGQSSTTVSALANEVVSDYGGAPSTWSGSTSASLFGVCVQAIGGSAAMAPGWAADGGTCTTSDGDPWKAVPPTITTIATTATSATGSVDLVWGVRFGDATAPGRYTATVAVEVVAPSV